MYQIVSLFCYDNAMFECDRKDATTAFGDVKFGEVCRCFLFIFELMRSIAFNFISFGWPITFLEVLFSNHYILVETIVN